MNSELIKLIDNIFYLLSYLSEYTHDNFKMRYKPKCIQDNLYCLYEQGDVMFCTYLSLNHYRVRNIMVFYQYENVFRMSFHDYPHTNYSSICTEYTNIYSGDVKFNPYPKGEAQKILSEDKKLPVFSELEDDEYFQYSLLYDLPSFEQYHTINDLFWYLKDNIELRKEFSSFDVFIRNDIFSLVQNKSFSEYDLKNNTKMMDLLEESFDNFKRDFLK